MLRTYRVMTVHHSEPITMFAMNDQCVMADAIAAVGHSDVLWISHEGRIVYDYLTGQTMRPVGI